MCCNTYFWGFQADTWENVHVQLLSLCNRSSLQIHPLYSVLDFSDILHCMFSKHVLAEKVAFLCFYSSKKSLITQWQRFESPSDRSYRKINWQTYLPLKKHTIRSLKRSENYTVYSRQMECIAFNKRNFRNYYNCT